MMMIYVACFNCAPGVVVPNNGTACVTIAEAQAFNPDRVEDHIISEADFAEVFPGRTDGTVAPTDPGTPTP